MQGWIKLFRDIENWRYFKNPEILQVFIVLLINANHKDAYSNDGTLVKRGQLMTSNEALSAKTGLSAAKIFRIVQKLIDETQIEKQGSNKNTIISITNFDMYQGSEEQSEKQMKSNCKASEKQVKTNKNEKNEKNEKNNNTTSPEVEVLNHLNAVAGRSFKPLDKNLKYIREVLKNFTPEEAKGVVDLKTAEWAHDERFAKYLRPETLFGGKFESYLQESNAKPKSIGDLFREMGFEGQVL